MKKIEKADIQKELFHHSISYDLRIIQDAHSFLDQFIGFVTSEEAHYHIPAACAIICETLKIPTVDHKTLTSTGITIENIMSHIGNLSKQRFLDTIDFQIKKSNTIDHFLIEKVANIKIAFRVFKKYKTIFEHLSRLNHLSKDDTHDMLSLFWLIFLICKHSMEATENINLSTKILALIIQEVFCKYFWRQQKQKIRNYITQIQNFSQLQQINEDQEKKIKEFVFNLLNTAIRSRDPHSSVFSNRLLSEYGYLTRIVDDLSNQYQKLFATFPKDRFIDEKTFLELTHSLTPQAIHIKPSHQIINKVLTFDDDNSEGSNQMNDHPPPTTKKKQSYEEMRSQSDQKRNFCLQMLSAPSFSRIDPRQINEKQKNKTKSFTELTPVSFGQRKLSWAQQFIQKYDEEIQIQIRMTYEKQNLDFNRFINGLKDKIHQQIENLTTYATKKEVIPDKILKIALCFFSELSAMMKFEDADEDFFNCLLSLSSYLYNSTVRNLSIELQKYTQIYKADIVKCMNLLYDINNLVELPVFIKQMLESLQKQVLTKQLWDTTRGYQLLLNDNNPENISILNRLTRVIHQRVLQICTAIKVDLSEAKRVEELVRQILNKKKQMFINNKLDQIILCSISACLNLNQTKYNLALNNIFQKYNTIPLSLNSNRQITGQLSGNSEKPSTLLQFYNKYFIHQVQEMVENDENPKYIYTPIRQNLIKRIPMVNTQISLASRLERARGNTNKYAKLKIQQMKSSQDKAEIDEEECESPYFGLKRKFTFGARQNNEQ